MIMMMMKKIRIHRPASHDPPRAPRDPPRAPRDPARPPRVAAPPAFAPQAEQHPSAALAGRGGELGFFGGEVGWVDVF